MINMGENVNAQYRVCSLLAMKLSPWTHPYLQIIRN